MIHYSSCPICSSTEITKKLIAKDYTVSKKDFIIWHCDACTARFTQDIPAQNEIGLYYQSDEYISHSDTKKGVINTLYHAVRNVTLNSKKRLVINELGINKGSILDIGCGTGAFLNTMKLAGWDITGLEPDFATRQKATALYKIEPLPSDKIFELPAINFCAITMWHVLEHVHQLHEYIGKIETLLTPNGKLFIAVPNYISYDAKIYDAAWAAYDVPRHLYHFSAKAMAQLLDKHNLKIKTIKPMWFDSFYVSMLSEKYKNGKTNFIKAVATGLLSNIKATTNKAKCSSVIYVVCRK